MTRRLGPVLAALSLGFASIHAAWALGWRGGVPVGVPPIAERPVFLAYDVTAGLLMLGAAGVAVALTRGGLSRRGRSLLVRLTTIGSVLALMRGVPALAIDVVSGDRAGIGPWVDLWFVVVGVLGLCLARVSRSVEVAEAAEAAQPSADHSSASIA